jgi:hypothetical protein
LDLTASPILAFTIENKDSASGNILSEVRALPLVLEVRCCGWVEWVVVGGPGGPAFRFICAVYIV